MIIKNVFIKELSQKIKVLKAETKKEIAQELCTLSSNITALAYKSWVLESFVVGINYIFSEIIEESGGNATATLEAKDVIYEEVLKLNPLLNPEGLYVGGTNTLTLTKGDVRVTDCNSWLVEEDPSNLMVLDVNDYFRFSENAKNFDHYVETEEWELFEGFFVSIRKFNKNLKADLVHGYIPKTEDDAKYFVVTTCVDNFHQLYKYLIESPEINNVPFHKIIYSLYDLCIKHNIFLDLKVKDFTKINKTYKVFREGLSEETKTKEENNLRRKLSEVPKKDILSLEDELNTQIFGQEECIKAVCNTIRKAYSGIKDPNTPVGAFFFYGPTSTGKTELAKVMAKSLTKSLAGLVKIPCNNLVSSHNVHTLLGSPPGYVGYEEKGLLEKAMENSKFKIILFDEIEKAHDKLFDLVLEIMEEGQLLMANGNVVDFSNSIIVFTSNVGQAEAKKATNLPGFTSEATQTVEKSHILASQFKKTLKEKLKPEFLARLNGLYYFKPLCEESLLNAARLKMQHHCDHLLRRKINLSYDEELIKFIINECGDQHSDEKHARNVRNFIDMEVLRQLGDFLLTNGINRKKEVQVKITVPTAGSNSELHFDILE